MAPDEDDDEVEDCDELRVRVVRGGKPGRLRVSDDVWGIQVDKCVPCFTARTRTCSRTSPSTGRARESGEGVVGCDEKSILDIADR